MAIFDFLYRRKIKAKRYFQETTSKVDLPAIKGQISKLDKTIVLSIESASIDINKKITIPDGGDVDELTQLDMLQYQLALSINTLKGSVKQEKTKEYVDLLLGMIELVTKNNVLDNRNTKKKDNLSINSSCDFRKLNKYLVDRGFQSSGLPNDLRAEGGYVIWPITLQPSATYIHTAQIQLIKLLILAGWKLHVIIGDCGKYSSTIKNPFNFKNTIEKLLEKNNIPVKQETVTLLSKYFKREPDKQDSSLIQNATSLELLNTFHNISDSVVWYDYFEYITKNYNKTKKDEIKRRKVLNNIQPLLNWTVVVTITNLSQEGSKTIVVAGEDEKEQWNTIARLHGNNRVGMIYIQELKESNKTMDQVDINIGNPEEMMTKLDKGNMGQWLYNHFIELPKFSQGDRPTFCHISDNECMKHNSNCIKCLFEEGRNFNHQDFDKRAFVEQVYEIANPN